MWFNFTEWNETASTEGWRAEDEPCPCLLPEQVPLASSSLFPQSFVPSQSHRLGMQRLLLHLKWPAGHVWLSANSRVQSTECEPTTFTTINLSTSDRSFSVFVWKKPIFIMVYCTWRHGVSQALLSFLLKALLPLLPVWPFSAPLREKNVLIVNNLFTASKWNFIKSRARHIWTYW